jgi:hypothetical protein
MSDMMGTAAQAVHEVEFDPDDQPAMALMRDSKLAEFRRAQAAAVFRTIESLGYRIVPVEPTPAMCVVGGRFCLGDHDEPLPDAAFDCWAAMLAASPKGTDIGIPISEQKQTVTP